MNGEKERKTLAKMQRAELSSLPVNMESFVSVVSRNN